MLSGTELHRCLDACFDAQVAATAQWHDQEPDRDFPEDDTDWPSRILAMVLAQHLRNFRLWHVEDTARRRDVAPDVIAQCKYAIDKLNQERNDRMERVDALIMAALEPLLPSDSASAINTESPGMAVDRLSILSLKIWHMREQTERTDADETHVESCRNKLKVLERQRADLIGALHDLIDEYLHGTKKPKLYFQFKMYNDPALNPQLYGNRK
ncbi:MAG: DUF4254 domain-containing protein [Desulfovibrionaceae bacterium]|nr:DUF4254 domain-containing protein [Desulfovibrionaceae bacterium]